VDLGCPLVFMERDFVMVEGRFRLCIEYANLPASCETVSGSFFAILSATFGPNCHIPAAGFA